MRKKTLFLFILCAFAVIFLWSQWDTGIIPIDGKHDSLRYLEMAETQSKGKWLGEYNSMTLIRSPVYSEMLSLNWIMGWPLQRTQTFTYILSVALLGAALRKMKVAGFRIISVCTLCACHPAVLISCRFVATEAFYTSVVTILLAGVLGVLGSLKKGGGGLFFWVTVLSLSLALAWRMRDESLWLIPAAVVYAGYVVWGLPYADSEGEGGRGQVSDSVSRRTSAIVGWKRWGIRFICIVIPVLTVCMWTGWIQRQNQKHYGVGVVNEMVEPGFKAAFSRLTRLDGQTHHPYVPITRKAMADAERVSPHFKKLYPFLSRQLDGNGWSQFGCQWMGVCDELAGGWAVWAVRDAANSVGVYVDAVHAAAFYADLAKEIETGWRTGQIACTSNPTGNILAPPLTWIDIPRIVYSAVRVGWMTLWMGDLPEAYRQIAGMEPPPELAEKYRSIAGSLNGHRNKAVVAIHGVLFWIFRVIQVIGGAWLLSFVIIKTVAWMRCRYRIEMTWQQPVWILPAILVVSRLAIVGYIDAMSYWAQSRYMMVIYPALITLFCLTLPSRPPPMPQYWTEAPAISSD